MRISQFVRFFVVVISTGLIGYGQAPNSRPLITGISHISVYSSDSAKTEAFYVHDLGGAKRSDPENPKGVRYYFSPTQFVEVLPLPAGDISINRLDHVAFLTANAEGLRQYMGAHGIVGDVVVSASTESPSVSCATFSTKVESTPPENATITLRIGANIARIRSSFAVRVASI